MYRYWFNEDVEDAVKNQHIHVYKSDFGSAHAVGHDPFTALKENMDTGLLSWTFNGQLDETPTVLSSDVWFEIGDPPPISN